MRFGIFVLYDEFDVFGIYVEEVEQVFEDDLWFLFGLMDDELDYLLLGLWVELCEIEVFDEWWKVEGGQVVCFVCVVGCVGVLDDWLKCGLEGWWYWFVLMEVVDLSWYIGDCIS